MKRNVLLGFAAVMLSALAVMAAEPQRWLNVNVTEKGDSTVVKVHVPLNLVTSVIGSVKTKDFDGGLITLDTDEAEVDWPKLLEAIKGAPDGDFVTVEAPDADVKVSKTAGTIHIRVTEKKENGAKVNVIVPQDLIAALNVDAQNRLDIRPLLDKLAQLPSGDLVTVEAEDANVRVWIE